MGKRRSGGLKIGAVAVIFPLLVALLTTAVSWPQFVPVVDNARGGGVHGTLRVERQNCVQQRFGKSCTAVGTFRSTDGSLIIQGATLSKSSLSTPDIGSQVDVSYQREKDKTVYRRHGFSDLLLIGGTSIIGALCWAWLIWCLAVYLSSRRRSHRQDSTPT